MQLLGSRHTRLDVLRAAIASILDVYPGFGGNREILTPIIQSISSVLAEDHQNRSKLIETLVFFIESTKIKITHMRAVFLDSSSQVTVIDRFKARDKNKHIAEILFHVSLAVSNKSL